MVNWSDTEVAVFSIVGMLVLYKLWTVWHVASQANASRTGKLMFLGLISGLSLFGVGAKVWISYQMGV